MAEPPPFRFLYQSLDRPGPYRPSHRQAFHRPQPKGAGALRPCLRLSPDLQLRDPNRDRRGHLYRILPLRQLKVRAARLPRRSRQAFLRLRARSGRLRSPPMEPAAPPQCQTLSRGRSPNPPPLRSHRPRVAGEQPLPCPRHRALLVPDPEPRPTPSTGNFGAGATTSTSIPSPALSLALPPVPRTPTEPGNDGDGATARACGAARPRLPVIPPTLGAGATAACWNPPGLFDLAAPTPPCILGAGATTSTLNGSSCREPPSRTLGGGPMTEAPSEGALRCNPASVAAKGTAGATGSAAGTLGSAEGLVTSARSGGVTIPRDLRAASRATCIACSSSGVRALLAGILGGLLLLEGKAGSGR